MTQHLLSLLAGIAIAVLVSTLLLRRGEGPPPQDPAPAPALVPPVAGAAEGAVAPPAPALEEPADAVETGRKPPRASSLVSGRVLAPDGRPHDGALVVLEILNDFSWTKDRELRWTTDASGSFRLEVVRPRDLMIGVLTIRVSGHADLVRTLESGSLLADVELGDVVVGPGAVLSGRLICAGGVPDWTAWRIFVATEEFSRDLVPRKNAELTLASESGEFRIEGLPEGDARLLVYHPVLGNVIRSEVTLRAGENEPVVLDYAGPDPRRCIRLRVAADGLLPEGSARLSGGGQDRSVRTSEGRTNDFLFTDLPDGRYELTIQPRKNLLWSGTGSPGLVVDADIRGKGLR
jgi:hypothetical protein